MKSVIRGAGTTESERYLAKLADQTFLNLWSYANLYIDKKTGGNGDGKELCDLLVVCGDHILIFSDKSVAWPGGEDYELAWKRWSKRAIQKSLKQIRGAERWINEYPERIFLDRKCTQPFPLKLPPIEKRKIHGIVVALGAGQACRRFFQEGIGSLMIKSDLKGADHFKPAEGLCQPFTIGDIDPDGPFVHVFDDATLDIVMRELDTISDFTAYLAKKEALLRSGTVCVAHGEEDLVAHYMTSMNVQEEHDFAKPDGSPWTDHDLLLIEGGKYADVIRNPQYIAKKEADEHSYIWDRLITAFTNHLLAGTTVVPEGRELILSEHEESIRYMALVPRYQRRNFGRGIIGALEKGQTASRFTRAFLPGPGEHDQETGFFFMTLKVPAIPLSEGYEQYREVRRNMLYGYALTFLRKQSGLKRIIGIATEPPDADDGKTGSSEDLILVERPEWTKEILAELDEMRNVFDIAVEGRYREYAVSDPEFPEAANGATRSHTDIGEGVLQPGLNVEQLLAGGDAAKCVSTNVSVWGYRRTQTFGPLPYCGY